MTQFAVFDCDGTLIRGDATRCFLWSLRGPLGLASDLAWLAPQVLAWRLGRCSTALLKQTLLGRALQLAPMSRREAVLRQLPQVLVGQLRPEAVARLRWHQYQGHRCLIVSASPEPLIAPLASYLGVELIATGCSDLLRVSSTLPFRLTTPNCKGPEKVRRLEEHLGFRPSPEDLEAYGDSQGDRELLLASARPHWRSFTTSPVRYPQSNEGRWFYPMLALALLVFGLGGVGSMAPSTKAGLVSGGVRLIQWLPALYGLLALSYLGRYARWRVLLGSCAVGSWNWSDALGWFRGFALTATPGKLGELSRVQQLHAELGYARPPLLHAFFAERFCDAAAVVLWLAVLLPQALAGLSIGRWMVPAGFVALLVAGILWYSLDRWRHWRRHLPSGSMLRACLPALLLSLFFWACEGLMLWLLVAVLAPTAISTTAAIGIYLLSGIVGMASSLPGGIGVNEATTMLLLGQQGIPAAIALPIAVLRRLITPWSVVAMAAAVAALSAAWRTRSQAHF